MKVTREDYALSRCMIMAVITAGLVQRNDHVDGVLLSDLMGDAGGIADAILTVNGINPEDEEADE